MPASLEEWYDSGLMPEDLQEKYNADQIPGLLIARNIQEGSAVAVYRMDRGGPELLYWEQPSWSPIIVVPFDEIGWEVVLRIRKRCHIPYEFTFHTQKLLELGITQPLESYL